MYKKLSVHITKHLHSVKDGLQVINYYKLFTKKIQISDQDVHADFDSKIKELTNDQQVRIVVEDSNVTVYGGFENSNILQAAIQQNEIIILLNSDTNTNGCTHWFHFILTARQDCSYTVKILNLRRKNTLYTKGNHIHTQEGQADWGNKTSNVFYYRTNINHPYYFSDQQDIAQIQQNLELYTLEFLIDLKDNIATRVAMNLPYTVEDLFNLKNLLIKTQVNFKTIGASPLGLPLYQVKFKPKLSRIQVMCFIQNRLLKSSIVFLARQHPSECQGSHICEALLKRLASDFRLPYVVVIFPMVNPDGVFMGNSRCNWHGTDLNRKWDNPDQTSPEVVIIKAAIVKLHAKYPILFMIDLHGHSNEIDQFIYGCISDQTQTLESYIQAKLFARMIHNQSPYFSYDQCRFRVVPSMKSTARVMFFQQFGIQNSLTIETSFYGYQSQDKQALIRFTKANFTDMANHLLQCILLFQDKCDLIKRFFLQQNHPIQQKLQPNHNKKQTKNNYIMSAQEDIFSYDELQKLTIAFSKGINPVSKEALPDSDSEAEADLKPSVKIILTALLRKPSRLRTEIQPVTTKHFNSKQRTQENQYEEISPVKPTRHYAKLKKGLAQLHLVDFNDSIENPEAHRISSQQADNEEFTTIATNKNNKFPVHNTFHRKYNTNIEKKSQSGTEPKIETRLNEFLNVLPNLDRPVRRQSSKSQFICGQVTIQPEQNPGFVRQSSKSQFMPIVQTISSKIRRQHSKSQLLVRQSPIMNNLNIYNGFSNTTCSAEQNKIQLNTQTSLQTHQIQHIKALKQILRKQAKQ